MDHVCRKLQLRSGDKVVEAGCGWAALALHAARHFGVTVKAFNLSREQISHARKWASAEGLDGRVEFVQDDYRNITGSFDAFMSVGMLEHVGLPYYRDLGRVIERLSEAGRPGPDPLDRQEHCGADKPLARKADFPGCLHAQPARDDGRLRAGPAFGSGCRKPPPALCPDPRPLAAALRAGRRTDRGHVRSAAGPAPIGSTWPAPGPASAAASCSLFQIVFAHDQNNVIPWTRRHIYEPLDLKDQPAYPLGCRH